MRSILISVVVVLGAFGLIAEELSPVEELLEAKRFEDARRHLEGTKAYPSTEAERELLLAQACNGLGDFECGVAAGERAVELRPTSSEAHYQLAVALRIKMSSISKIKAMFVLSGYKETLARAIELDPGHVGARSEEIGFLLGAPAIAGGSIDEAAARIDELAALDRVAGLRMRARLAQVRGDGEAVISTYTQLLELDADDGRSRMGLVYALQQAERYREADRQLLLLSSAEDPGLRHLALYQRARTRILGEFEAAQAVAFLEAYLEKPEGELTGLPSKSAAAWRLGMACEQADDPTKARSAYELALELDPDNEEAEKALEDLG